MEIQYSTYGKALPPRPIRMSVPGWSGAEQKMEDGSEPQPWHCLPFVEASTYALELLYPYETQCQVVNENGVIRFDWDFAHEPGAQLNGGEFVSFFPKHASRYYLFNTSLDLRAPAGHVIRTEPHPRFFTDQAGTAPLSMIGHVQTEWWPKRFFVVFKAPPSGQRHIFCYGEPYAQILVVPQRQVLEAKPISAEEGSRRRELESAIFNSKSQIARNIWRNPTGYEFNDHYKVLARAFARDGMAGVEQAVEEARGRQEALLPKDKSIAQCLDLGYQRLLEQKYTEARQVYMHVLSRDPGNAEALCRLGIVAACTGTPTIALELMSRAVALQPQSPSYHSNLAELLRRLGRLSEAEAALRNSLRLNPNDPQVLSNLGLTLAQQGRSEEGLEACRAALAMGISMPSAHHRMGLILARQGKYEQARLSHEAALALDPNFAPSRRALQELPPASASSA